MTKKFSKVFSLFIILALMLMALPMQSAKAISPDIVISQVYGGGGNGGATYTHDFVELFNRGTTTVSLSGWSIQYASATGTGNLGANSGQLTPLSGSLAPGQYLLVQEASTAAIGAPLPVADVTDATPINMSGSAGKVALVHSASSLGCNGGSTACLPAQSALIIDLVGFGSANFFEGSSGAAPTLSNTTAAFRDNSGCVDTDDNASDFSALTPAPRNSASPLHSCADAAPDVESTYPVDGATDFPINGNLSVTFTEPVNTTGSWFGLSCSTSGAVSASVSGGPITFSLDPGVNLVDGETCTLTIYAANITDQDSNDPPDNMQFDFTVGFTAFDVCAAPYTAIYDIQGDGPSVAIAGSVTTQGIVVGDYEGASPALRGFFIQDPVGDGIPATSDGIFVFEGSNADTVSLGDVVRVTGNAGENQGQSQISVGSIVNCGTGTVTPTDVTFPVASSDFLEQYEGMLVRLPQTMYVTEHFQLGRFDQVVLSVNGKLKQPTNVVAPGAPALALQNQNNLSKIILDDASQGQNPDPILFARGGQPLSASNTLRGGDTATGIVGVLNYTWAGNSASGNAYRVRPVNALGGSVNFEPTNPRPTSAPAVGGTVEVVGMNLLNFFNTFDGASSAPPYACNLGVGGALADCRGADDAGEFARQWPKTVAAILAMNPDVLGVNEIENDGYGPESAIAFLVDRLNEATAPGTYAFIDVDANTGQLNAMGTDAIKVGMLYKPASVTPVGQTAALNTVAFVNGGDNAPRSRPSLAQAFEQNSNGARFVVDVNHFKSKGSACNAPDAGDGQANCNSVRVNAAIELTNWLASDPTGIQDADIVLVGDYNSYAMEDPITVIKNAGYTNLIQSLIGSDAYSYVFDGQWGYLDHGFGSPTVISQITGIAEYHINSDEPSVLDYNDDFKTANLIDTLYAPDQFRVSDHDPVVVGLNPLHYNFSGFFQPVDNAPVVNVANAGSSIPVKFSLGGPQGLDIFFNGYPISKQIACDSHAPLSDIEQTVTAGNSSLSYNASGNQYNYVWKTDKAWAGTCRQFVMILKDGSIHTANFSFK